MRLRLFSLVPLPASKVATIIETLRSHLSLGQETFANVEMVG